MTRHCASPNIRFARLLACLVSSAFLGGAAMADDLRLIPMPREVVQETGRFALDSSVPILLADPASAGDRFAATQLVEEVSGRLRVRLRTSPLGADGTGGIILVRPSATPRGRALCEAAGLMPDAALGDEGYLLRVEPKRVVIAANAEVGIFYGVQTLKQLVRANRSGNSIPCVRIRDYPALRYRGILDDITRGQMPTMDFLEREVRTLAEFKMNLWTPYIEHQFEFEKHPLIGPKGGSLTAEQARELTEYARQYHVEIVGCFQSFAHFQNILAHPEYAHLGETDGGWILRPVSEDSYRLLADLYSEIVPAFESPMFNICCDETYGLGEGKSKPLLDAFGIEWLYATHINRIHDMLARRGKRMMMWADIALSHPGILDQIPRDTILLSWGYHAAESFDSAIVPIAERGFTFFVCPGVNCWGRMFPDIDTAMVNIRNYTRDGARHGALGMINTCWDDDGQNLFSCNWYPIVFGGDCAWHPEQADPASFAERFSECFYGTADDSAARAVLSLAAAEHNPRFPGLLNGHYWVKPTTPATASRGLEERWLSAMQESASEVLADVSEARHTARVNADNLDYLALTVVRMRGMAERRLDFIRAAELYHAATDQPDAARARAALVDARRCIEASLSGLRSERRRYERLWLAEARPYWLSVTQARYAELEAWIEACVGRLLDAEARAAAGQPLPSSDEVGLPAMFPTERRYRPKTVGDPLPSATGVWYDARWHYRVGVRVDAGSRARTDLPVEVEVDFGSLLGGQALDPGSIRVVSCDAEGSAEMEVASQLVPVDEGTPRVVFIAPGRTPEGESRYFRVYFDTSANGPKPTPSYGSVTLAPSEGGYTIENERIRCLVLPEGAHAYDWSVKALGGLEITEPGRAGWAGFLDAWGSRDTTFTLTPVAAGPVMARLHCQALDGTEKTITAYAGSGWVESDVFPEVPYFWCFDPSSLMSADSETPGTALFSTGATGAVPPSSAREQVKGPNAVWGCKTRADGLAVALVTPGRPAAHSVGPGGGWGGVGIEGGPATGQFICVGDVIEGDLRARLDALESTLDLSSPPSLTLGRLEQRPDGGGT